MAWWRAGGRGAHSRTCWNVLPAPQAASTQGYCTHLATASSSKQHAASQISAVRTPPAATRGAPVACVFSVSWPATSCLRRRSTKGPSSDFMRSVSLAISSSSPWGGRSEGGGEGHEQAQQRLVGWARWSRHGVHITVPSYS